MVVIYVQKGTFPCIHTLSELYKYSILLDLEVKIKILKSAILFIPPVFHVHMKIFGQVSFLQKIT